MTEIVDSFRNELVQYVMDRTNDGCNRNIAFMHAASQARGAARALKLMGKDEWHRYEAIANEFWEMCFIDAQYAKVK